ncbi:amidohydrolase family protein [Actinacidiphila guanduensis]|uniref:Amidohydrolase family protein n=1 Tax=Actinacidiphila guanduensis TaxID=310781 RepID=A0A1H0S135_9ACTN|nr:hypothetical protein [Actinacidiphila guanduensis]SDP35460.1 hypothetical protein SAMN05216259_12513 [Actinacidiphila guanduensis]
MLDARSGSQSLPRHGRPIVVKGATVITVDPALGTLADTDVLVVDGVVAQIGRNLQGPEGTFEIDARGGILLPGMVDTHRHMWQTTLRGFGADWTLTDYFDFFYAPHARLFRPQDIYAGNLLEALDAGVTTSVDWSHNLQTVEHAEAALDALEGTGGRFVLAYGNLLVTRGRHGPVVPSSVVSSGVVSTEARTDLDASWRSTSAAIRIFPRSTPSVRPENSVWRSPRTPACGACPVTTASAFFSNTVT